MLCGAVSGSQLISVNERSYMKQHQTNIWCFLLISAEGDSLGKNLRQCEPAGLPRLLPGVAEQAESQQLRRQRRGRPLPRLRLRRPQMRRPRRRREELGGLLQGGRAAVLLQLLQQAGGGPSGLPERLSVRQLLLLHQSGLQ